MCPAYKYTILLCLIIVGTGKLLAQENVLDKKIIVFVHERPTDLLLQKISELTGARFSYDPRKIPLKRKTSVAANDIPLSSVLQLIFEGTNVEFQAVGNNISLYRDKLPKYTISGYLREATSGEALIGGNIYEQAGYKGTSSNIYGFYSLTLPEGAYAFNWTYLGYKSKTDSFFLGKNQRINVSLEAENVLKEVIVYPKDSSLALGPQPPPLISSKNLDQYPALMGERDPLRVAALFPGIQSGSEGSNGLSVRGGGPDQNMVLLDGVPIYNVYHLFGFLSVFNGHAVNSAEVIKDGFPARYGGRLSSVLDVRMKEGSTQEYHGGISVGLISASLDFEGPLVKDKTSFFVSGRRTYLDLFARAFSRFSGNEVLGAYGFYDLNIKINHKFSEKSRLYLSTYLGEDKSLQRTILNNDITKRLDEASQFWGNKVASLRYNWLITPRLFSNTAFTYSNYAYGLGNYAHSNLNEKDNTKVNTFRFRSVSRIDDFGVKHDFDFIPNVKHYIRFGLGYVFHYNQPSNNRRKINRMGVETDRQIKAPYVNSQEYYVYFEDDYLIHEKIKINAGLHLAGNTVKTDSTGKHHTYLIPQFRLNTTFMLSRRQQFRIAYSGMGQFTHLLTDPGIGFPNDLWVPSTEEVKPSYGHQVSLGYDLQLKEGIFLSFASFYKWMFNLLEYQNGATFYSNSTNWENNVTSGKGSSYGGELLIRKDKGKTRGWLSYTLSWADRNFSDLNEGRTFPFRFDRRHSVNAVINHRFGPKVDVGAVWSYGTGNAVTLSLERYLSLDAVSPFIDLSGEEIFDLNLRNNYRMPAYHRLDISANFHRPTRTGSRTWTIGIVNVYSRQNPFTIYPRKLNDKQVEVVQFSMLPIPLPYATYSFRF